MPQNNNLLDFSDILQDNNTKQSNKELFDFSDIIQKPDNKGYQWSSQKQPDVKLAEGLPTNLSREVISVEDEKRQIENYIKQVHQNFESMDKDSKQDASNITEQDDNTILQNAKAAFTKASLINDGIYNYSHPIKYEKDPVLGINIPTISRDFSFEDSPIVNQKGKEYLQQAENIFSNPKDYEPQDIKKIQSDITTGLDLRIEELKNKATEYSRISKEDIGTPYQTQEKINQAAKDLQLTNEKINFLNKQKADLEKGFKISTKENAFKDDDFNNPQTVQKWNTASRDDIINDVVKKQILIDAPNYDEYVDKSSRAFMIDVNKLTKGEHEYNLLPEEIKNDPLVSEALSSKRDKYKMSYSTRDQYALNGIISAMDELAKSSLNENSVENQLKEIDKNLKDLEQDYKNNPTKESADIYNNAVKQRNEFFQQNILPKANLMNKLVSIAKTSFPELIKAKYYQKQVDKFNSTFLGNAYYGVPVTIADVMYNELLVGGKALAERAYNRALTATGEQTEEQEATLNNYLKERTEEDKFITPTEWKTGQLVEWKDEGFKTHPSLLLHGLTKTATESLILGETGVLGGKLLSKFSTPLIESLGLPLEKAISAGKNMAELTGMTVGTALMFGHDLISAEEYKGLSPKDAFNIGLVRSLIEAGTEKLFFDEVLMIKGQPISESMIADLKGLSKEELFKNTTKTFETLFGKKLSKEGYQLLYNTKQFLKEAPKVAIAEAAEEVSGDFGNYILDKQIKDKYKTYQSDNQFNLKSEFLTAINTMATMLPQGIIAGRQQYNNAVRTSRYVMSQTPSLYIDNIKNLQSKGLITNDQAVRQLQLISEMNKASALSEPINKLIDKSKISDVEKERRKIELFNNNLEILDVQSKLNTKLSDKEKEEYLQFLQDRVVENANIQQESTNDANLSEKQVEENRIKSVKNLINDNFSEVNLLRLKTESEVNKLISATEANLNIEKNEELKKLYSDAITKLNNRLSEIKGVIPTSEKPYFEQTKEKINSLSKEELEKLQGLPEIIEAFPELNDDEADDIWKEINNKLTEIDEKAKQTLGGFSIGDKVNLDNNKTDKFYIVEGQEEDGRLILTAKFKDNTETTRVKPEDVVKYSPTIKETKTEETVETEENATKAFEEQKPTEDIEAKKADIERRRQEELKGENYRITEKSELYQNQDGDYFKIEYTKDGKYKLIAADENGITLSVLNSYDNSVPFDKVIDGGLIKVKDLEFTNRIVDKINAKYDAELAALEQPKQKVDKPNEEKALERIQEINKRIDEIKDLNQKALAKNDLDTFDKLSKENNELIKEHAELSKLVPQVNVEEVKKEIQGENKKSDEQNKKDTSVAAERMSYFGTSAMSAFSNGTVVKNVFTTTLEKTLEKLKNTAINLGKSYADLGYYVTLVPNKNFPQNQKALNIVEFEKSVLEGINKEYTKEDIDNQRFAVITDKEGNFIYFDEQGNETTKEKGNLAYANTPIVRYENGKYKLTFNEKYDNQKELENLYNLKKSETPVTLEIEDVSNGVSQSKSKEDVRFSTETKPFTLSTDSKFRPQALIDGVQVPVKMDNISTELAEALVKLVDPNLSQDLVNQLPLYLQDYAARFNYVRDVFYNKLNGKVSLDKDGSVRSSGNRITTDVAIKLLTSERLNFSPALLKSNFTFVTFKDGGFNVAEPIPYTEFVKQNSTLLKTVEGEKLNRYITFGDKVKNTTAQEQPKIENKNTSVQVNKTITKKKQVFKRQDLPPTEEFLRKKSLLSNTTPKQEKEAEEWFKNSPLSKHINFKDFRDIINSDAYATWTPAALKLWKGGKYSDLYHEAWHEFSQLYLTPEQRNSLYNEVRNTVKELKDASDFDVEEYIAEDFYKYVLSGQKLILNNQPKRNSLFRKIYNFLKELFTGNVDIQTYYERLYSGDINKYNRDLNNSIFGKLNSEIEGVDQEGNNRILTLQETKQLNNAIDRAIASEFEARKIPFTKLFTDKGALTKLYNLLNKVFENQAALAIDYYNAKFEEYGENPSLEQQAELQELSKTVDNLSFIVNNWNKVVENHKENSKYLKVAKDLIDDSDDEDIKHNDWYDNDNTQSSKEQASYRVLYTIASLPKYIGKEPVANPFIAEYFTEKDGKLESWLNPDVVEFDKTWNLLSKTLQNTYNYNQIYNKIKELAKIHPEFDFLIGNEEKKIGGKLPNPIQALTEEQLNFKHQFIQDLSKPIVTFHKVIFRQNENGKLNVYVYKSESSIVKAIKQNFATEFSTSVPTEFIKPNSENVNTLDTEAIIKNYSQTDIKKSKKFKEKFLKDIGFNFSEDTLNSDEFQELFAQTTEDGLIYKIWKSIKEFNENKTEEVITNPIEQLSKGFRTKDKVVASKVRDEIEKLLELEAKYNDDYYTDSITNANGDNIWQIEKWSLQTFLYNTLSNAVDYPTYGDLIKSDLGYIFNIATNPDMDNIYINSLFDLSTGERRKINGVPVTIDLINEDGLEIQPLEGDRTGIKTTNLTPNDKFLQDFNSLLTSGIKEHVRYGDKNSSKGTLFNNFVNSQGRNIGFLPVPTESFNQDKLPNEAVFNLNRILKSELTRNRQYSQGIGENWKNFNKNIKSLGLFDGIIKGELKDKLLSEVKTTEVDKIIKDNQVAITEAYNTYFKQEAKKVSKLLDKSPLSDEQKINENLLKKGKETLIKSYAFNNWLLNTEHIRLMFSDIRFYDAKEGKVEAKKDPFKRFSKASSTGLIAVNDNQTITALNNLYPNLMFQKAGYTTPEGKTVNTVIFNEDIRKSVFIPNYEAFWKSQGLSQEEINKILSPFEDMKIGDGQGWGTLDFYRSLKLRQGSDHWTKNHEALYQAIANNTAIPEQIKEAGVLFNPLKIRVSGFTQDKNGFAVPVDYKFAIVPIIPQAIKNTPFEQIHQNMLRQGVGIGLFESGSKHSAIMNDKSSFNKFYDNEEKTLPFTGDYVINPISYDFIYDVLNIEPELKNEVTFSTQLRRLLFSNLLPEGKAINKLSEKLYNQFNSIISDLVNIEKEAILSKIDAKLDEKTGQYIINQKKFATLLEKEFKKRNLPDNLLEILKTTQQDKFKYPLDASVARQTIESVAIAIVDNKLRKQKGFGEALIQAASSGFELNDSKLKNATQEDINKWGTNDLPFYKWNKNKPTSAAKIKVSISAGEFKKLLNLTHTDGKKIETLDRLNEVIKDDKWLNTNNHRQMITITGVRIPVQGHNSMEFMEIYHFLPEEAGNIIIVSPELVAKSGGDFDVDKLTTLFPQFYTDENSLPKLYEKLSDKQILAKYEDIKQKFAQTKLSPSTSLIAKIFGISEKQVESLISEEIFDREKIPTKEQFIKYFRKAALQNELNNVIRQTLEQPENFKQLMLPNSTDIFEKEADKLRIAKLGEKTNYFSDISSAEENYNQFASNLGGKKSLDIGAVFNAFFPSLQATGAYLNDTYVNQWGTVKDLVINLPHNTTSSGNTSVSGVYDKENKHLISESISQLMNGWLDIAKKDWVYYMNGIQELAPTQLYMLMTGVNPELMQAFTNQPIIDDYIDNLQNLKSLSVKLANPEQFYNAKKQALINTFEEYVPWDSNDEFVTTSEVNGKVYEKLWKKDELNKNTYIEGTPIPNIYLLRNAILKNGIEQFSLKELKPTALRQKQLDKLRSVELLSHFLQLQEQASILSNVNKTLNADRAKPKFLHESALRANSLFDLLQQNILPKEILSKLYTQTPTSAFNNQKTGIDKFIEQLFGGKQIFDVTNHPTFNEFISNKWNKDQDLKFADKYDNKEEWFKTIKNDLISFIYQNYVINPVTNQLVVDEQYKNLLKSKTNGDNISLGDQLLQLKQEFPELSKEYTLVNLLTTDNSKKLNYTNIKLKKDNIDADLANILTQNFEELLQFSKYDAESNLKIQNLFKNIAQFGFIQSGLNKSPLSFVNIIPQDYYANNISDIIKQYATYLDNPDSKEDLAKFYERFKENNVKFYTVSYELDEDTQENYPNINFNTETYRFKDYRIKNVYDSIGNRKEIVSTKEELSKKNKITTLEYTKGLAEKNPNTLFVYETDVTNTSTGGSGAINETSPKNVIALPLRYKASSKPDAYFIDNNFAKNKELIDSAIGKILELSKIYKKIAFPQEGVLTSVNKLTETAPLTAAYLVNSLQEKLAYTDKNFNFDTKPAKLNIPQEVIEQPINKEIKGLLETNYAKLQQYIHNNYPIGTKIRYFNREGIIDEGRINSILHKADTGKYTAFEVNGEIIPFNKVLEQLIVEETKEIPTQEVVDSSKEITEKDINNLPDCI